MAIGILGRKVGMTQIYDESGAVIPVTIIQAGPCHVLQVRSAERDGYEAVQLGFLDKSRRRASRSERGHVARLDSKRSRSIAQAGGEAIPKADCEPKRFVREIRGTAGDLAVGAVVTVDALSQTKRVDVTGTSKGRGFAGVIKRHNFSGQRATHGVKKCHRALGGTGCSASPSRLFKGRRMPGQYGAAKTTVRNQAVVRVDAENDLLIIKGGVPGPNGSFVVIRETNKLG
jgi:large subunit ribosomal protein L3